MRKKHIVAVPLILLFSIPNLFGKGYTLHLKSGKSMYVKAYTEKEGWYHFVLFNGGEMYLPKETVVKVERANIDSPGLLLGKRNTAQGVQDTSHPIHALQIDVESVARSGMPPVPPAQA